MGNQLTENAATLVEGVKARDPTGVTAAAESYVSSAYNWVTGVATSFVGAVVEEKNEKEGEGEREGEGEEGEVDPLKKDKIPPSAAESMTDPSTVDKVSSAPSGEVAKLAS